MPNINDYELLTSTQQLEKQLKRHFRKQKSLQEQLHDTNNKVNTVLSSVNNVFSIVTAALSNHKNIPLPMAGFIMEMIAVIPQSAAILIDPDKSTPEKIIAAGLLGVISTLAITAFVIGATAGAIISSVIAGTGMLMEGLSLFGLSTQKYTTAKSYQIRKEFDLLVEQKIMPESDQYNQLFELRAIELQYQIKQPDLKPTEHQKISNELDFIEQVLAKKSLSIGTKPASAAAQLVTLYKEREVKMALLATAISQIKVGNGTAAQELTQIKNEVIGLDNTIKEITAPKDYLKKVSNSLNSKIALSSTTLALSGAGFGFSILGILLATGAVVAPPLFASIMLGVGITMSVIGLLKWGAEKYEEYQSSKSAKAQLAQQEQAVLHEAVTHYELQQTKEHQLQSGHKHTVDIVSVSKEHVLPTIGKPKQLIEEPIPKSTENKCNEGPQLNVSTAHYKQQLKGYKQADALSAALEVKEIQSDRGYSLSR